MADYPQRESFYAHRFVRLLTKAAVAQWVGPEVCWLLTVIVHQEDARRYLGAVTYWNEQLMPLCGFGSRKRLVEARRKAVEAGWLCYEAGGKGRPGKYWTIVPARFDDLPDGPCDESPEDKCRSDSERKPERNAERQRGAMRNGKGAPFFPSPIPSPDPNKSKLRFDPTDDATARWMFGLIRLLDEKASEPDFAKWANELRLMRERDKRTDAEIRDLFSWANADSFWSGNVLCPATLRKHWTKLGIQRSQRNGRPAGRRAGVRVDEGSVHPDDAAARATSIF